jgi:RNA polymerase sigma-70 factor, ECF subfamily
MDTFHEIYVRHAGEVRRFALYLSGNAALADDITSETFVRAWTASGPIREATVKAYLFAIARNLYRDEIRRSARLSEIDEEAPATGPPLEASAEQRVRLERVLRALRRLPEIDRAALLLYAQEGMSYQEIAHALSLSLGTVKVKIHRARLRLAALVPQEQWT